MRALIAAILFSGISIQLAAAETRSQLKLALGGTALERIFNRVKEPYKKATGVEIVQAGKPDGSSTIEMFKLVESGEAEGGCTASTWSDIPPILKSLNFEIAAFNEYTYRTIGMDIIRIYLNRSNSLNALTDKQTLELLTGKVKNWHDVGGADVAVTVIINEQQSAANFFVRKKMMNNEEYAPSTVHLKTFAGLVDFIGDRPGAVGFASAGYAGDKIKAPKQTTIGRPLVFFTKGKPSEKALQFLNWLKGDGQQYVPKAEEL